MSELDLKIIFDGKKCLIHKNKNNDNLYIKQKGKNINVSHLFCKNKQVLKKQFQLKHRIKKIKGGVLYAHLNNAFVNIYNNYVTLLSNNICKRDEKDDKDNIKTYILKLLQGNFDSKFDVVLKEKLELNKTVPDDSPGDTSGDINTEAKDKINSNIDLIIQQIISQYSDSDSVTNEDIMNNDNIKNAIYDFYKKEYFIYLNLLIDMLIIRFMYVQSTSTTISDVDGIKSSNSTKTSTVTNLISKLLKLENFRDILLAYNWELTDLHNDLYKFKVDLYIGCLGDITSGGNYHTHTSNIKSYLEYLTDIKKYNYIYIYDKQDQDPVPVQDQDQETTQGISNILSQDDFFNKNSDTRISEIFKDIEVHFNSKKTDTDGIRYEVYSIKEIFINNYEAPSFKINFKTYEFKQLIKTTHENLSSAPGRLAQGSSHEEGEAGRESASP